jgi:hypothetical protein
VRCQNSWSCTGWGQAPVGGGPRTEEREIDVVRVDGYRTPIAIGRCKWTNDRVDFDELNLLDRLAPAIERRRHLLLTQIMPVGCAILTRRSGCLWELPPER